VTTRLPLPGRIILILSGRYVSLIAAGAGQVAIRPGFLASMTTHGGTVASSAAQAAGSRGRVV
jgi:hypothetical protein